MKKLLTTFMAVFSVMFLIACQSEQPNEQTIEFNTDLVSLPVVMQVDSSDGAVQIPFETDGENVEITWSSSNSAIASVDENGMLTAHNDGDVTITAESGTNTTVMRLIASKNKYTHYTKISTKAEFLYIFSNPDNFNSPDKFYSLATDIDFGGDNIEPIGGWDLSDDETPIDPSRQFRATLDGRGYALKNFTISNPGTTKVGTQYFGVSLIPFIDDGVVRNLNIIDAIFSGSGFTGSIAGKIESGIIENSFVRATITSTSGNAGTPSGGIAGIIGANATVSNVIIDVKVNGGHIFSGFNFGTGIFCTAISETLADDNRRGPMRNTAITTNKGDEEEDAALNDFVNSLRVENEDLGNISSYSLSSQAKDSAWAITDTYMPFIIRVDGETPSWAKIQND